MEYYFFLILLRFFIILVLFGVIYKLINNILGSSIKSDRFLLTLQKRDTLIAI